MKQTLLKERQRERKMSFPQSVSMPSKVVIGGGNPVFVILNLFQNLWIPCQARNDGKKYFKVKEYRKETDHEKTYNFNVHDFTAVFG
jgi:hypothetical protein